LHQYAKQHNIIFTQKQSCAVVAVIIKKQTESLKNHASYRTKSDQLHKEAHRQSAKYKVSVLQIFSSIIYLSASYQI